METFIVRRVFAILTAVSLCTLLSVPVVAAAKPAAGQRCVACASKHEPRVESTAANQVWGGVLRSVAAVSPTEFWMVGDYYGSKQKSGPYGLVERWDGMSGTVTPVPSPDKPAIFNAVAGTSPRNVWAVGDLIENASTGAEAGFIDHWNGKHWERMVIPARYGRFSIDHVVAISWNDAWVSGVSGSLTQFFEHWNGKNWSFVPSATVEEATTPQSGLALAAVSPRDIWAVGQNYNYNAPNAQWVPLIEHWNGRMWSVVPHHDTQQTDDTSGGLVSIAVVSAHNIWAVGGNESAIAEHWNGKGWSLARPGLVGLTDLVSVAAISHSNLLAIGQLYGPYRPYIQRWDGSRWAQMQTPFIGNNNILTSVAASALNDAWAVGGETYAFTLGRIPIEHWNGKSWRIVEGPRIGGKRQVSPVR